jgi:F0F1-type ATP synthase assembly protein I
LAPALILLPIIPIPILYTGYDLECGCRFSIGYLFYYSTLAPYLLLFVGNDKKIQEIFYIGWLPSFISGILIAYTSGNGYVSAGLGMLSSTIVTTLFLIKALKLAAKNNNLKIVIAYGETLATLLSVIILASSQYYLISVPNLTYRDADIYQLHTKIEFGPFRGLYTTQYKKKYLAEIYNDLNAMYQPGYRVVFYYNNFPAGYLLTPMRSATNISFLVEPDRYSTKRVREGINNYIRHQIESYSVIAVKMKTILLWDYFSYSLVGNSKDFISQTIEQSKGYQLILSKKNYLISKIEKNEFKDIPD